MLWERNRIRRKKGHGATEADTHEGYAYTNKTYDELLESELSPFMAAAENRIDASVSRIIRAKIKIVKN